MTRDSKINIVDFANFSRTHVAVIGGGAWGTALAMTSERAGRSVSLWIREAEVAAVTAETRENAVFLPGCSLPASISVTADLATAARDVSIALLVVPSQHIRAVAARLRGVLPDQATVVICSKGVEQRTGALLSTVVAEELPDHPLAVLSGPTFAAEVAAGMPTAVTIASADAALNPSRSQAARVARALGTRTFRPYVSDDVIGVEVSGAVKNVIALASGMATGLGFGANTRAALISRGLNEIQKLGAALGGRRDTVTGLSGVGDLTLTCSSEQSRNMRFGMALAAGRSPADVFEGRPVVVEGVDNAVSVTDLARGLGVDMPICEAVRAVVVDGRPIPDMMDALLRRPFKGEPTDLGLSIPHDVSGIIVKHIAGA
ncbi:MULTISPECIES: NAD(P)H-dependent glycerol-3-phosphate dehydrogenase [unclassified Chelatococcus]|uniref:NAD(P)H-dependent glycerol-3-phosphate dehydrogenase n=1 Tax=unclassified Chelatococcus TaxID=2638111 RepID=UPI001BCA69D5|nr:MULTISPECIES: NAD(P)H-dependent glycerol-3-phosphate dehydrogenase [unclassified Chelatococcus]MBS7741850.1 NAD(P)-dependent glycerol-3-phosphate dehydrogenase [Chelatococcus sp. HY11]MBX3541352.1 NAD(P)-dependent glycerol-3-phosphate dehydrogenase [Chelatococcus sp.]CAH1648874.1 Glycerol-3-phosphate dehydrogenase (NAD(P)+) [Hyphomicrobiales bacterium]CAH1691498.1 Glycerol-3-phosphate dehydrogenase (NAD(P)+) [Hyphomicrobiales bacterium]